MRATPPTPTSPGRPSPPASTPPGGSPHLQPQLHLVQRAQRLLHLVQGAPPATLPPGPSSGQRSSPMAANCKIAKQSQRKPSSPVEFSKQERKRFLRLLQDIHLKTPAQKLDRCKEPGGRSQVKGDTHSGNHQSSTKTKSGKERTGDKRGRSTWNQEQVTGGRPQQQKRTNLRDRSEEHIHRREETVILANSNHTGTRPKKVRRDHLVDHPEEENRWGTEKVTFRQHPRVRSEFPREQIVDLTRTARAPRKQVHQGTEPETQKGDYLGQRRVNINQGTTPFTREQGTQAHLPCIAHQGWFQWEKVWRTNPTVEQTPCTPEVEHKGLLWTKREQAGVRGGPGGAGGEGGRGLGDRQGPAIAPPPGFSPGSRKFCGAESQEFCEGSGGFFGEQEPVAGQQTTNTDNIIYFPYKTKNLSSTDLFYIKQLSANSLGQQLKDLNCQLLKLSL